MECTATSQEMFRHRAAIGCISRETACQRASLSVQLFAECSLVKAVVFVARVIGDTVAMAARVWRLAEHRQVDDRHTSWSRGIGETRLFRNAEVEGRADIRHGFNPDTSAMVTDYLLAGRKADSGSRIFRR